MKKNLSNSNPKKEDPIIHEEDITPTTEGQDLNVEILQEAAEVLGEENPLLHKIEVAIHKQRSYAGPIPHAEEMAKYEAIMPGATDRIIGMAELHGKTSSQIANRDSETRASESKRGFILMFVGIVFAFVMACAFIGLSFYLIFNEKTLEGFGTIIIGIIVIFALAFKSKIDMNFLGLKFNSKEK